MPKSGKLMASYEGTLFSGSRECSNERQLLQLKWTAFLLTQMDEVKPGSMRRKRLLIEFME